MKRKKRASGVRGPIEIRAGGKRYYAYNFAPTTCGLMITLHDRQVLIPVMKPVEIYSPPGMNPMQMLAPPVMPERRVPYDPQLPHTAQGNLTLDELAEREERQRKLREQEIAEKRELRNMEFEEAANGSGLPPFVPTLVGNG